MGKDLQKLRDSDILDEKYKGANPAVAAAGEAYYAHYWMALVGLIGGGLLTYVFHEPIIKMLGNVKINKVVNGENVEVIYETGLRSKATGWLTHDNFLVRCAGKAVHGVFGTGNLDADLRTAKEDLRTLRKGLPRKNRVMEGWDKNAVYTEKGFGFWLLDHTIGLIPGTKGPIKEITKHNEGISVAVTAGGLLGAIGFFIAPWLYAVKGVHNANQGKDQFKRAQEEVKELREDIRFMEEKNAELRAELRNAKGEAITISKDDLPKVENRPAPEVPNPHDLDVQVKRKDDQARHVRTEHHDTAEGDRGEAHTKHKHHSDRHKTQQGKSHSDQVRDQKASTTANEQAIA